MALAKAYHLGEGVPKDEAQAVQWWEKAAEHGDAAAQVNLGAAYTLGAGVPKNYAAAVRWYTKAADQGNPEGQRGLALSYHTGQGVPKDDAEPRAGTPKLPIRIIYRPSRILHHSITWVDRVFHKTPPQLCVGGRKPPSKAM
ncbi:MAG: tetratricopeptide repeat protein [Candidatus Sulfotelmatobacter sp.]